MNLSILLVRIVSPPQPIFLVGKLSLVRMRVEIASRRKKKSFDQFEVSLWGKKSGSHFLHYYGVGDYIMIKGFFSFKKKQKKHGLQKKPCFSASMYYPFLLMEVEENLSEEEGLDRPLESKVDLDPKKEKDK